MTPDIEKGEKSPESNAPSVEDVLPGIAHEDFIEMEVHAKPADVKRAFYFSALIIIIIAVLIPIPLGSSNYIFSSGFFTAWMVVAMVRGVQAELRSINLRVKFADLVFRCRFQLYHFTCVGKPTSSNAYVSRSGGAVKRTDYSSTTLRRLSILLCRPKIYSDHLRITDIV